jgi:mitotic spindle assembly checkpoint protein MAD2B
MSNTMADQVPTFRGLVSAFTEFLTVAIHTVLYERSIYPQTSFLTARRYNHPVRQSRHPKVCEWINDAILAVETQLLKGVVSSVAVVIISKDNKIMERFVFDASRFPAILVTDLDTPLERKDSNGDDVAVLPVVDMEEQFRANMSRFTNCQSMLKPLPQGCTFTVAIELKPEGDAPVSHPQPWVPAQAGDTDENGTVPPFTTTPLRKVKAGDLVFETWIEEGQDKP